MGFLSIACCCILDFFNYYFAYGCCDYVNAVCCAGTEYCCPSDYPICDVEEGLCLQKTGDYVGLAAKKRKIAKYKFPWTKSEEESQKSYQALQWKRNPLAALR